MKKYDLEFAILFTKSTKDTNTILFPINIIFGNYDQENRVFVTLENNKYEHIIKTKNQVGYFGRCNVTSINNYKLLPKWLIKKKLMHEFTKNYYFCFHENSYKVPILITGKSIPKQDEKIYINSENKDYTLLLDIDSVLYYNEYYKEFAKALKINIGEENNDPKEETKDEFNFKLPNISDLYSKLTSYVLDQDEPIKKILTAIWKQYNGFSLEKSRNILVSGKTGVGKTKIFNTLIKNINIPAVIVNATSYTASGYVGSDVQNMLVALLNKTNGDLEKAQKGILIIDEIDKLAQENSLSSVGERKVQEELLKLVEAGSFMVSYNGKEYNFDTSNLMVIAMGSFSRIDKSTPNSIGFESKKIIKDSSISRGDMISNGMIPEFIGRFPIIIELNDLDYNSHLKIIKEGKYNIININKNFFESLGIKLTLNKGTHEAIAKLSSQSEYGAREIDSIVEKALENATFEVACHPDNYSELIISPDTINDNKKYILKRKL